jgi:hypothetical protein
MSDEDYYGAKRSEEKIRGAEWLFAVSAFVLALLCVIGLFSMEAVK